MMMLSVRCSRSEVLHMEWNKRVTTIFSSIYKKNIYLYIMYVMEWLCCVCDDEDDVLNIYMYTASFYLINANCRTYRIKLHLSNDDM